MTKPTNTSPTISVLFPVYNAGKFLGEAVESILGQTYENFELLVIDDGSTDNSLEILEKYVCQDKRIHLVSRENRGIVATLNELLGLARGEFVARMDADDIAYPERFAKQVEFLQSNEDIVCVGGAFDIIDCRGRFLNRLSTPQFDEEIQKNLLAGHASICHPSVLMRVAPLRKIGGYDSVYHSAEDMDLWLRLGEVGRLANLPDALLKYRLHGASVSEKSRAEQKRNAEKACEGAWRRRNISGRFEATEHWRPDASKISQHAFMMKYGWWAFNNSQRKTAMIYGFKAIRALPLRSAGWKLLACAMVKPMPRAMDNRSN